MTTTQPPRERTTPTPVLETRDLTKRFGGLVAADAVSLEVHSGEVVGLVGDNGAGKSTLIKMISGVYQPDGGEIYYRGERLQLRGPLHAREAGIETIYQDLALAPNLDPAGNIFLGRELKRHYLGGLVHTLDEVTMHREAEQALSMFDVHIPSLKATIETLSGGQRQAVAIARARYWNASLMIMDEPTNNLGVLEQRKVLDMIRTLRDEGIPVILISHTLPDIFAVTDRLVVMHRGKKVAQMATTATDQQQIIQYMMGATEATS